MDAKRYGGRRDSIEHEGLIEPMVVTASSTEEYLYDIVDGRHRKWALEELGVQDIAVYTMPGDRDYAVPTREAEVDVEIQSMAANVLRKEQTQVEEARFLNTNIEKRIVSELIDAEHKKLGNNSNKNHADARVTPLQLIDHLENVENGRVDWKLSDKQYQELRRLLSAVNCEPKTASEHIRFYTDSPDDVVEAWKHDDITKGFVKQIRQISQDDLRAHALEKSKSDGDDGYSTRDVEKVKKVASSDAPKTHENLVCGDISELDDAVKQAREEETRQDGPEDEPVDEDGDRFEKFKNKILTDDDREQAERIADYEDSLSVEKVFKECYRIDKNGDDYKEALDAAVEDINTLERDKAERNQKRQQDLDNFDFRTDSRFADGEADHLAPPVETESLGVFFHDVQEMDDEVADEGLQLIFTSPPYFTQSDSIVERWWPERVKLTDENITEENVDLAYQNYLDEMAEILSILHSKLREGRYMILNVSDIQAYGIRKIYDVPSDLSYIIRNELNSQYDSGSRFQYDATITWDKGKDQTNDRATAFFSGGRPLTYHPNWRCERLLVFRKGSTGTPNDEFTLDSQEFQHFSDDIWQISNETIESDHSEGFATELAMTIIQLYSYPGDTVADPFGGYGITPFAVKTLNEQKYPSDTNWKGLAWENFSSESTGDMDFRERTSTPVI